MARSLNKIILVGNCAGEPEARNTPNAKLAQLTVATNEYRRDLQSPDQNTFKEITEWHRVICWNKNAEFVLNNVNKGTKVYVEGHLRSNSYPDKNNPDIMHRNFEVVCDVIYALDGPKGDNYGYNAEPQVAQRPNGAWSAEANNFGYGDASNVGNDYSSQGNYDGSNGGNFGNSNNNQQMPVSSSYTDQMGQPSPGQGNNQYNQGSQPFGGNNNQYGQDFNNQSNFGGNSQGYNNNQQGFGNGQQGFGNNNNQNNNGGNGGYGGGSSNGDIPF